MQYKLIMPKATAQPKLLLFFNGWAMPPESVTHLRIPEGYDLCIVWDYRDLRLELDLRAWQSIDLVAWSMGVWAADAYCSALPQLSIQRAVAICGTGYPISDHLGIPTEAFRTTLQSLDEKNRERFNRRMCGRKTYPVLYAALSSRSTDEIRAELEYVYLRETAGPKLSPKIATAPWTLALVGGADRIIPAENQLRYWHGQAVPTVMHTHQAHYILGDLTSWDQLWSDQ